MPRMLSCWVAGLLHLDWPVGMERARVVGPAHYLYPNTTYTLTISLVRHAQGIHHVEGEKDHKAYSSEEFFDAPITPLGWNQVANLKKHVDACGLSKKIELVIASPLLRTMQTAAVGFGGEGYMDGIDAPPLMVANAGKSIHPAISSLNCPPFIAVELCRERMIESDVDILWKPDTREKDEELATRGMKLWTRPEKEIAVVTHKAFLVETLSAFGNDCHPSIKSEICKPFNNCELRSFVIVDRSMTGSDSSTTNYPGKIPCKSDLPTDVTKEKHPASGMPTKPTDAKTIKKATIMRKLHNCFRIH
ncbi:hypothetical protein Vadar_008076 [Vaccinium darrowii]|uniref:Uncharacterized protein n=1 Tax=Vaccinium darrowii TaxID=229202 RepID=A0ACB7Y739_9ERIC|nr:hypothetical protein Vadar_008076 [Vaccinium darrowii]